MSNITNTSELTSTISDLIQEIDIPNRSFEPKMNASEINAMFTDIEDAFNRLYEKLRELEDLYTFTQLYIQNEFEKNKDSFDAAIQKLDQAHEDYQNTKTKAATTTFQKGVVVTDRDGSPVDTADILDGTTILPGSIEITQAEPVQVNVSSNDIAYRRSLLPADQYKTFYASELPRKEKITESIDFLFNRATTINFIRTSAFNASIKSISVRKKNQELMTVTNGSYTFPKESALGIHIELEAGRTNSINMDISQNKDSFDSLNATVMNAALSTVFEQNVKENGGVA